MTRDEGLTYGATVSVFQRNQYGVCDLVVHKYDQGGQMKGVVRHRRVMVALDGPLSEVQATLLLSRMVAYVVGSQRGSGVLRRGLPWREVGVTEWTSPVPPSGGEGGERAAQKSDRTADVQLELPALPSASAPAAVKPVRAKRAPIKSS
jgi:hypothetical protein